MLVQVAAFSNEASVVPEALVVAGSTTTVSLIGVLRLPITILVLKTATTIAARPYLSA